MARTENIVFKEFTEASEGPHKEALERELQRLLLAHALSVAWLQLKEYRPDIANFCVYKAFQKFDRFRGEAKFSTWFHRIALNACTSNLRLKLRQAEVPLDSVVEKGTTEEGAIIAKLQIERIADKLDAADKQFLQWKLEQLDETEIAKRTGLTLPGVRSKWSRIRKRILRQLKK